MSAPLLHVVMRLSHLHTAKLVELIVHCLGVCVCCGTHQEFCREPALMLDLYVNYDCDVACTNLFEELCRSLCRNAVPESGPLTTLHVLSLEGILAVVENMARR